MFVNHITSQDQQATVLVNDVFEEDDETVTGGIVTRNGVDREATYNTQHYTVSQDIVEVYSTV